MDWIATFIFTAIGSIILSIVGNLLTERYKDWIARWSITSGHKRLNALKRELQRVTTLNNDKPRFYLEFARTLIEILSAFSFGIGAGITGTASYLIATQTLIFRNHIYYNPPMYIIIMLIATYFGALMFIVGIILSLNCLKLLAKIIDYQNYKTMMEKRITELSEAKKLQ